MNLNHFFAAAGLLVAGVGVSATVANAAPVQHSAASKAIPAPAAAVPELFGGNTAVALDSGFTGALTSLGLTPGVLGTATLSNCGVSANSSSAGGAGGLVSNGTATLTNCSISGNSGRPTHSAAAPTNLTSPKPNPSRPRKA